MEARRRVVVFGKINQAGLTRLRDCDLDVIEHADRAPDRINAARGADAILVKMTPIDEALLQAAPDLVVVSRHGTGYDTVDVDALTRRGIPLALTGDVVSTAVAEHTLALILSLAKRICAYDSAMRQGNFAIRDAYAGVELDKRTLLLIGYGRIGRKVAPLARAFGLDVLVFDPFIPADATLADVQRVQSLEEGLGRADIVSIHAPKPREGGCVLDARSLDVIKRGAIVINVSRGGMVDEHALLRAIDEGRIAAAGLDVFEREPPPPDDPLLRHPGVVLSPHCAAYTQEASKMMAVASAENVIAAFEGRLDPKLVANPETLNKRVR